MKLYIEIPSSVKLLVGATPNSGAILQALTEATLIDESGWGKDKKYTVVTDRAIEVKVLPDDFMAELPDTIKQLQAEKASADSRWVEYYNKANAFEKQLKALQADLDAREISYKKDEVKP